MNFGPRTPEDDAHRIIDAAVEAGVNFIDTANQYGGSLGVGTTEAILGRWFAADPSRRDKIVLATKVFEPMSDDVNDRGLSARHIQMACEASLKRLNVDHIDLYQMHHIDRVAPAEEIWEAMDRLRAQGKITYVGSSNFPGWQIARTNERAQLRQALGLISEQSLFNLIERRVELEVLPACRHYGVGLLPWSPMAGGLLAGKSKAGSGRRSGEEAQKAFQQRAEQLDRYSRFCADIGHSNSAVALAWLLAQPGVSACITGPAHLDHLKSSFDALEVSLDRAALDELDRIFPPCGEAPEAYAW